MPDKYYQEYGPIKRRRGEGGPADGGLAENGPPEPPERGEPTRQHSHYARRPRRRRSLLGPLLLVLFVTLTVVAFPLAANLFATDRPAEGVTVRGFITTGMSRSALAKALEQRYAPFLNAPLTLEFEGRIWTPTLSQLGATVDLAATAGDAAAIGRRGGPTERVQELWSLWREGGYDVAPRVQVDSATLQAYLTGIAPEIEQPPRDAALSIASGKVIPTAGVQGRQLLADATARDVMRALLTLEPQTVALRTRLLEPTLPDSGIAGAVRDAQTLLKQPIMLAQGERRWTWQPDKISELLTIRAGNGVMTISPDVARLTKAIDDLAQLVDSGSAEPRVAFRGDTLKIVQEGTTGWQLVQPEAVQAISKALWLEKRTVMLPVAELKPQVTAASLPDLGVIELVGEGKTSFAGSASYRVQNIKAGSLRMDGVLIPPDAEFSFNTQLGEVDEANGFVQGYAVIGNRTQLEWGGGVCQDSTTLFRAAFWAGLPITERHAHPFYISWYDDYAFPGEGGAGMDAAIYTGVSDLKFVNDTGKWLLLESTVDEANAVLTMRLYGTRPNREVTIIGPQVTNVVQPPSEPRIINDAAVPSGTFKQTDTARKGMDIAVYRVISVNGEQREPELFFTRFKAWPNVFVRGTGE